jgi:replicative DNA helicase
MAENRRPIIDASRLFDRLPPHDFAAEMSVIGALIVAPDRAGDVAEIIGSSADFYDDRNRRVYAAAMHWIDSRGGLDLVQLVAALKEAGENVTDGEGTENTIDVQHLELCAASVPSGAAAPHYARIVAAAAKLRRLAEACDETVWAATTAPTTDPAVADGLIDAAAERIARIGERAAGSSIRAAADIVRDRLAALDAADDPAVSTGLQALDGMLSGGLRPGELTIIAARPSMGKTALALNIAEHVAEHVGPVLFISCEMSAQALCDRAISARAGVAVGELRRLRTLDRETYRRVLAAADAVAKLPLRIVDDASLALARLRQHARRAAADARREGRPLRLIAVDYLQLLTAPGNDRERRDLEIGAISRGLKAIARELNVPVVCLSQLNRAAERREGNRPRMSDLRESGSIEQDADVVILLHREDYYAGNDPRWADANADRVGTAELIIAKQRNGATGTVDLDWNPELCRFTDRGARTFS